MLSVWFVGFIAFILGRAFYAGMKSKTLFYRDPIRYGEGKNRQFDEVKLYEYGLTTLGIGIFWPITFPVLGVYMLGKRYQKEV